MKNPVKIYKPKKKHVENSVAKETEENRQLIDKKVAAMPKEYGGRKKEKGLEPTRYGDWENKGRCVDF